jgi:hypothetical protein
MLDKLIMATSGLKRGAPSRGGPGAVAPLATFKRRLRSSCFQPQDRKIVEIIFFKQLSLKMYSLIKDTINS